MTWQYELTPTDGTFAPETLQASRAYWSTKPIYTRSDGLIVCMETIEDRDWRVSSELTEGALPMQALFIDLKPERIDLETHGGTGLEPEFYDFAIWLSQRVSIAYSVFGHSLTLEEFRSETCRARKT